MNTKRCFFIGHRDTSEDIIPSLENSIEHHIKNLGVTEFIVGHYGSFDKIVAKTLIKAKQQYPHIHLTLLLPYHPAEKKTRIPKDFDSTYYPDGMETVPYKAAIIRANRYAIDHSDYLIAYVWHAASNSREILEYAYSREKRGLIQVTLLSPNNFTE